MAEYNHIEIYQAPDESGGTVGLFLQEYFNIKKMVIWNYKVLLSGV